MKSYNHKVVKGSVVRGEQLRLPRSISIYNSISVADDCDLVECRKQTDGSEAIFFTIKRIGVPDEPAYDIHDTEEVAVICDDKDVMMPEVYALRKDFPVALPHSNAKDFLRPVSLCISDVPFLDIRHQFSAFDFIGYIRRWFLLNSLNKLHEADRPIEVFFAARMTCELMLDSRCHCNYVLLTHKTKTTYIVEHAEKNKASHFIIVICLDSVVTRNFASLPETVADLASLRDVNGVELHHAILNQYLSVVSNDNNLPLLVLLCVEQKKEGHPSENRIDLFVIKFEQQVKSLKSKQKRLSRDSFDMWYRSLKIDILFTIPQPLISLNRDFNKITKELILLEDDKDEKEKEHKKHIEQITALHELLDKCNQRKVDLTNGLYFDERKEIVELANKVSSRETELSKVNESIKEKRKYLEDIDQLIAKSREMVSQIEGGVCPLCGFDYKSHNALLQSISSNTVINESLEKDVQTKESIETEIRQLSSSIETKYAVLIGEIEDQIDQCRSNLLSISQVIKERSEQIKQLSSLIQEKENRISLNFKDISNIPEEKKRELLENQKAQLDNEYKKNEAEKNQNKSDLEAIECQLKATSEKIENATKEISEAKTDELYLLMTAYSTAHSLSEIDKDYIINAADNIHKDIEKQENALMTYNNVVAQITVNPEQEEFVTAKQKEAEAKLGKASLLRSKIITTIEKNCKIDDLDKQTAKTIIEKFEDEFALLKKDIKEIEKEIATISRYTDILNLIDKIRFNEKLQDEISYRTKRKKELCDYKEACVKEISDIEQYLKKFVTGYFELDLINRLYNTIDPHPDYKQVKFECDFKNKNPRLKVLLNNIEDGKESIVPNLYFSTAQINILSFCIFLAKALFAKDSEGRSLDCIFIDDPIQALDEINILSIIDLLRNVAFSMDKQIVLTTHDRNFFELLQKKVPDNLFDSRFITLPERGKFNYL